MKQYCHVAILRGIVVTGQLQPNHPAILMEKGGISLEQINRLLSWQVHLQPRLKSSQAIGLLVSIILLVAFPYQLSGSILTGSVTSSQHFTDGAQQT